MMDADKVSRRGFGKALGLGAAMFALGDYSAGATERTPPVAGLEREFLISPQELTLRCLEAPGRRRLSFANFDGAAEAWRKACRAKLAELIGFAPPSSTGDATRLRRVAAGGVTIEAWTLRIDENLVLPAYLLIPKRDAQPGTAVMALHGHGPLAAALGYHDDYHHMFALRLAQAGRRVLCPELRGFGALADMAASDDQHWLDYWGGERCRQFTLITDSFLYGRTVIGHTVQDLLCWENWLADTKGVERVDAAGISYGGDLAITYPAFSARVGKIYASGTLGSFSAIFARCYNAPAHCVPGVLQWMDRSDIAGLSAPRPMRLHYGELDRPSLHNASASYNETAKPALNELRAIYRAFDAEDKVTMHVSPNSWHEFDLGDLVPYLAE